MKDSIRKLSGFALWAILGISFIIVILFYFGGEVPEAQRVVYDQAQPKYTDLFINWGLFLFGFLVVLTLTSCIYKVMKEYRNSPQETLRSLGAVILLFFLLVVTWFLGDTTSLKIPGYYGKENIPFWLRITDMWLYSICVLLGVIMLLIAYFAIRKRVNSGKEK
jgi:multisubunit Na+/H+ antiporter MnhB subunit